MKKLGTASLLVIGASLGACGGNDKSEGNATPTGFSEGGVPMNPVGTVGGQILNVAGDAPMADVTVNLVSAGATLTAKTDMNGLYSIQNVPAGSFILSTVAEGFEGALLTGILPGAQGI